VLSVAAFVAGFLLAAWVRQPDLEKERVELSLCRDREKQLEQLIATLKAELADTARGLGEKIA
jgi:hypothetical protein